MMAFECSNPLWGRSTNPWNNKYTCGGSSGGECAILAMDGSAFGLGSDIGGSLRIPASYCGIYSLKPTHQRINSEGAQGQFHPEILMEHTLIICVIDPTPGFEGVKAVVGPMARYTYSLYIQS
jgi:Asp-tRNA(Asn)/Glu-tRNA(Gln) amidotransferase A subunit family amidase